MYARELLRTTEPVYRELGLAKADLSEDELIKLMVKHPDLIQRPIVERGPKAVLGRPVENIKGLVEIGADQHRALNAMAGQPCAAGNELQVGNINCLNARAVG